MRILLGDGDVDALDVTAQALRREGLSVITATEGSQALHRWQAERPDVVVLEADLPQLSGFEVCRQIRESGSTPVVLLSALATDEYVVRGFRLGADDYVLKPFKPWELALRIRAIWRRVTELAARSRTEPRPLEREVRVVWVGDFLLDLETHEVRQGESVVHLTPTEFRLLHLLASNAGRVVTATRLVEYAWGSDRRDEVAALLRTHLSHLRKKLRLPRRGPGSLAAVSGVGYRLDR